MIFAKYVGFLSFFFFSGQNLSVSLGRAAASTDTGNLGRKRQKSQKSQNMFAKTIVFIAYLQFWLVLRQDF